MPDPAYHLRSHALLLLTAAIWGSAFVFQEMAIAAGLETFLFNAMRFALGGLLLLPLVFVMRRRVRRGFLRGPQPDTTPAIESRQRKSYGALFAGGALMGVALATGSALQQAGLVDPATTAGKGGFITGLYVVLVPVLGLALGRRTDKQVWVGVVLALVGLFFLSINLDEATPTIGRGDLLVLLGSVFWAGHILLIDHLSKKHDALLLSLIQFFVCALLSTAIGLAIGERVTPGNMVAGWHAIAYCGVMAVGVAYTLQVVAQRHAHPTAASIILSTEVLFAAIAGALVLGESMSGRAYLGCGLLLAGMLIAQLAPQQRPVLPTPESA